jgi:hypothetical protein
VNDNNPRTRYYEFHSDRLVQITHTIAGGTNVMLSYRNPFLNNPNNQDLYAYFSSYKAENGYNMFGNPGSAQGSDCKTLGVWPYAQSWTNNAPANFLNPKTCQIISCGSDGLFGTGTKDATSTWTPSSAFTITKNGLDDISNFHPNKLGAP